LGRPQRTFFILFLENKELKTIWVTHKGLFHFVFRDKELKTIQATHQYFLIKTTTFYGYWTPHNPLKHAHLLKIEK
jgi:hypothetical protein